MVAFYEKYFNDWHQGFTDQHMMVIFMGEIHQGMHQLFTMPRKCTLVFCKYCDLFYMNEDTHEQSQCKKLYL
jgi:hypothetical protein